MMHNNDNKGTEQSYFHLYCDGVIIDFISNKKVIELVKTMSQ